MIKNTIVMTTDMMMVVLFSPPLSVDEGVGSLAVDVLVAGMVGFVSPPPAVIDGLKLVVMTVEVLLSWVPVVASRIEEIVAPEETHCPP
jgi:hypothetical protein